MSDENQDSGTPFQSDKAKQMLAHALSNEYTVLEFNELDDDTIHVVDITDHVEKMEEFLRDEGYNV